jgi:hypothetical protein
LKFLLFEIRLNSSLDLEGVSVAYCLYDKLIGNALLGAKSKALIDQDINCNAGIQADGEGYSIDILTLMQEEFSTKFS